MVVVVVMMVVVFMVLRVIGRDVELCEYCSLLLVAVDSPRRGGGRGRPPGRGSVCGDWG